MNNDCEASGLPLPICRHTICDCFDHEDIEPASEAECETYFGPFTPAWNPSDELLAKVTDTLADLHIEEDIP